MVCGSPSTQSPFLIGGGRWQPPVPPRAPRLPCGPTVWGKFHPSCETKSSCPVGPGTSTLLGGHAHLSWGGPRPSPAGSQASRQAQAAPGCPTGVWPRSGVSRGGGRGLAEVWGRLGGFSPEIQTIGQSVLDRFRSSEVKKKIRKYSVKAIFSLSGEERRAGVYLWTVRGRGQGLSPPRCLFRHGRGPLLPPRPTAASSSMPTAGLGSRGLRGASSLAAASGSQQSAGDSHGCTGQADKASPCQGPAVSVSSLLYPQGLERGLAPGRFPA